MNNSKPKTVWSRGRVSTYPSSDPISDRASFGRKTERAGKKSIFSRLRRLFHPKTRKPVSNFPDGLKGFFEPVEQLTKFLNPAEILFDSENKPSTERERKCQKEPISDKWFFQPLPVCGPTAATAKANQKTPRMNKVRVSNFKNQRKENFEKTTQAETLEATSRHSSRRFQVPDRRVCRGRDNELPRYSNTGNVEDWVEEVRIAWGSR